jgi:hypothetical protein
VTGPGGRVAPRPLAAAAPGNGRPERDAPASGNAAWQSRQITCRPIFVAPQAGQRRVPG